MASRIAVQSRLYIREDVDRPPTGIPKGEVLIGQRPSVRHLMPEDRSLVAIGLRLVQKTYSDSIDGGLIWHTLMKFPEHKPLLLDLARSGLLRHRAYPTDWHEVWFTCSRERPLNSKEIGAGQHWLGRRSGFGASHWAEIWDVVAQRRQNDRKGGVVRAGVDGK
jgi:hypothetical protein